VDKKLSKNPYNLNIRFKKNKKNILSELSYLYNSDKGSPEGSIQKLDWNYHIYTDIYNLLFNHCKLSVKNVFELGIGTTNQKIRSNMGLLGTPGASLRMWKDYFPNANIIGADIDVDILFEEERIKTFYVDQTDQDSIRKLWDKIDFSFDIMIDDGLHDPDANINFYKFSKHKNRTNGIYIIEDVKKEHINYIEDYLLRKDESYFSLEFDQSNNNLITNYFVIILNS
jgi:hypothetical protein